MLVLGRVESLSTFDIDVIGTPSLMLQTTDSPTPRSECHVDHMNAAYAMFGVNKLIP